MVNSQLKKAKPIRPARNLKALTLAPRAGREIADKAQSDQIRDCSAPCKCEGVPVNQLQMLLFASTVFIWGSTWYAIKFQLGVVDHTGFVTRRFFAASALIFLVCRLIGVSLKPDASRAASVGGVTGDRSIRSELLSVLHRNGLSRSRVNRGVLFDHGDLEHLGNDCGFKSQVPIRVVVGACVGFCGRCVAVHARCIRSDLWGWPRLAQFSCVFWPPFAQVLANLVNARNQKSRHWSVAGGMPGACCMARLRHWAWRLV